MAPAPKAEKKWLYTETGTRKVIDLLAFMELHQNRLTDQDDITIKAAIALLVDFRDAMEKAILKQSH